MIGKVIQCDAYFVAQSAKAYKAHVAESGTPFGPLGAAHWIRFAGLHNQRHNKQIAEVMADPKFPK